MRFFYWLKKIFLGYFKDEEDDIQIMTVSEWEKERLKSLTNIAEAFCPVDTIPDSVRQTTLKLLERLPNKPELWIVDDDVFKGVILTWFSGSNYIDVELGELGVVSYCAEIGEKVYKGTFKPNTKSHDKNNIPDIVARLIFRTFRN
jgi:hypothetical protein